jgi:hypothetical protein
MTRRAFTLSLAAGAALRGAETSGERAKRVIDKTIYALGGDAFRNMQTRAEIGRAYSFYREQINGLSIARLYTKYLPPGEKFGEKQRQVLGKKQEDAIILTATEGWEITFRGAKALPADRTEQFRETALHDVFYILRRRLGEPGIEFDSRGAGVEENQPVEIVDVYDAENRKVTVWINSTTWLPVKQSFLRPDPVLKDRLEELTRFTKYRDAGDGVMWPHAIERSRDGEKIFVMYSEQVTVGKPLDDSLFRLPPGVKMWKPGA